MQKILDLNGIQNILLKIVNCEREESSASSDGERRAMCCCARKAKKRVRTRVTYFIRTKVYISLHLIHHASFRNYMYVYNIYIHTFNYLPALYPSFNSGY